MGIGGAVCRQGPCGPMRTLEPWVRRSPPDLRGFCEWVFEALGMLNDFVRQVVVARWDSGLRCWATWLREDLGSRPYAWLRPDLFLLLPSLLPFAQ